MKKLTKTRIEEMANEIVAELRKRNICDTIVYFNDKRILVDYGGETRTETDIDPHDYFEWAAYNHILSMSFEGQLYWEFERNFEVPWLAKIFDKYGVYSELGDSWNLSVFPINDDMEIEFTVYEKPKPEIYISKTKQHEDLRIQFLCDIYRINLNANIAKCGGSCVIGDGIKFILDGNKYFFSTNYNQSEAPKEVINVCKKYLEIIGATEIYYDCGRLD